MDIKLDLDCLKDFLATYAPESELIVDNGVIEIEIEGFSYSLATYQ